MNFNQLQYFITAAKEENFTRASELLHMTQPALSKAISRLEDELCFTLFERQGKRLRLNESGKILYEWAVPMLEDYKKTLYKIELISPQEKHILKIAFSGLVFSSSIIIGFHQEYPDIEIDEDLFSTNDFPNILFNDDIDIVLSTRNVSTPNIESLLLYKEPLCFVCPKNHRLAAKSILGMSQLRNIPIIFPKERNLFREQVEKLFEEAGVPLTIVGQYQREHWREVLINGQGCGIVAEGTAKSFPPSMKCRILYFEEDTCQRGVYSLWKRKQKYPYALSVFIEYLNKVFIERA